MELILRHQQEVVHNCSAMYKKAIKKQDNKEAHNCMIKWIKESGILSMLEELNTKGVIQNERQQIQCRKIDNDNEHPNAELFF